MPPKKAAAAASAKAPTATTKKVNGVKSDTKAKSKPVAKASSTKASTAEATTKKAPSKAKPIKPTDDAKPTAPASKKRIRTAEVEDEHESQVNGKATKRAKKDTAATVKKASEQPESSPTPESTPAAEEAMAPATTRPRATPASRASRAKPKPIINAKPEERLDLYLFGGGEAGELGFGGAKGTKEIKRPRINPLLAADKAGTVQFAVGGMHTAALTYDNKILTWGVNDQGALGRDTNWDGGLKDVKNADDDSDDDSDSDDGEMNPHESTPGPVDFSGLEPVPVWVYVVASDSATFALTQEGLVYGWGTFRSNEGIFGFSASMIVQERPVQVPGLKNITTLAAGTNHILALDKSGAVYAWGAGQQNQLGRRVLERHQRSSLTPTKIGLKGRFIGIGAGSFHSFAIRSDGEVFGWGLNSFGQTGADLASSSDGSADVHLPVRITSLAPDQINGIVTYITGGSQHSIAITSTGQALTWGRVDGFQIGIDISSLPESDFKRDEHDRIRILLNPTALKMLSSTNDKSPQPPSFATTAAAGSDHSIVVTKSGKAYSFGFNEYGQCGVGNTDDVKVAELIENTAVRGKMLVAAGCGGQFSVLASKQQMTNGATPNGTNGASSNH